MKVSVVIPAHNEEDNIADAIDAIERSLDIPYELIIVDDHSADNTRGIVNNLSSRYKNIRLVENTRAKGFVNAIKAGFDSVTTEAVVPVMADLCDNLSTISEMYVKINEGYDVVCGSRYIKGGLRLGGSKVKGFFSCFVGRSIGFFLGIPTSDISNAFKMYRRAVIEKIDIRSKGFEVSMELPLKAFFLGFKITEVPTVWRERTRGKSNFKMLKVLPDYLKLYIWAVLKKVFR